MIRGRPMVEWAVAAAKVVADAVVLVLPPGDIRLGAGDIAGADAVVSGGATRSDSVRAGLSVVPAEIEVIVVHDGARPLATTALFARVIDEIRGGADAAVPALEVTDTLKRVSEGAVVGQIGRDGVVAVQTPQAFRADLLRRAHEGCGDATDDAGLLEVLGIEVRVVPGERRNLKVTTPADLELVQAMAEAGT